MKKKIAILGSTGSIGKNLLDVIKKEKNNYQIILLTANKNYSTLLKQAKKFNVKNLIIKHKNSFKILKKKIKKNNKNNIQIYNNYLSFNKIFKKKIHYVMNSISGIDGLEPTLDIIKFTKKIAIANKESIICAWNLISKELSKNNTQFIPVDSEHFSLWYAIKGIPKSSIEKIYLTASGGPLLKFAFKKPKNIKLSQALNHPTWSMGKKISIDSCTMMNKVFEVIEAKHLFNLSYKQISILTHPNSYVHAIVKFKNGLIKIIAHDTTMKVPIYNTIMSDGSGLIKTDNLNLIKLNNLELKNVDYKLFPIVKTLKNLPEQISLYETSIISINDHLVNLFLNKKINYNQLQNLILKFMRDKELVRYKKIKPKNIQDILLVKNNVSSKINKYLSQND